MQAKMNNFKNNSVKKRLFLHRDKIKKIYGKYKQNSSTISKVLRRLDTFFKTPLSDF